MRNRTLFIGICLFILIFLFSFLGTTLSPYTYDQLHLPLQNKGPCSEFWFGTDDLGRDIFTRVAYGAKISIGIGLFSAFFDLVIGVIYGCTAAYFGGKADEMMMRLCDSLNAIPYLLLAMLLIVFLGPGFFTIVLAISITGWINMARIVRSEVLRLKYLEFVTASKLMGASSFRIIFHHFIPNLMHPIMTTILFTIPLAIFTESFLSFLGLGIQAPVSSWGVMINDGISSLRYYPWRLFFPSLALTVTILSFNLIGEGLKK